LGSQPRRTALTGPASSAPTDLRPAGRFIARAAIRRVPAAWLVIAACAAVGCALRCYQLSRPGYLDGVTEYDDGVLFGNALRLLSGVIPYRDFSMVQPPGSMLLIAPAALLGKIAGTTTGLAASRVLTVAADTANIVLLGALVRHRGPVAVLVACGCYAVYPDAIVAAHTFLLEPWLNLFCLLGALAIFDGDRLAARGRLAWGGAAFGFATAVKIWALVPLAVAAVVVMIAIAGRQPSYQAAGRLPHRPAHRRRTQPRWPAAAALAGGAVLGLGIPLLPFLVLAPGALVRGVVIGQAVREAGAVSSPLARLTDLAGAQLLPGWSPRTAVVLVAAALVACCWALARSAARRPFTLLDGYALGGLLTVAVMFLLPRLYYTHYGAFAGPFLALTVALPAGALHNPAAWNSRRQRAVTAVLGAALGLGLAVAACSHLRAVADQYGNQQPAVAARLIPAGACVLTNDAAYTVAANRFDSGVPGCPEMVDSFGAYFAMTSGQFRGAPPAVLRSVIELWQTDLEHAQYVWFTGNTDEQIPWTRSLYGYFSGHYRLIGLAAPHWTLRSVPRPGLYVRR
jgi:alpha-1,2-mannosyltransferase